MENKPLDEQLIPKTETPSTAAKLIAFAVMSTTTAIGTTLLKLNNANAPLTLGNITDALSSPSVPLILGSVFAGSLGYSIASSITKNNPRD
jgi:hypothetical protein